MLLLSIAGAVHTGLALLPNAHVQYAGFVVFAYFRAALFGAPQPLAPPPVDPPAPSPIRVSSALYKLLSASPGPGVLGSSEMELI